jgi:hypothetical protein
MCGSSCETKAAGVELHEIAAVRAHVFPEGITQSLIAVWVVVLAFTEHATSRHTAACPDWGNHQQWARGMATQMLDGSGIVEKDKGILEISLMVCLVIL